MDSKHKITLRDLERNFELFFPRVVKDHYRKMVNYAVREYWLIGEKDAEDLVQQVFIELWRASEEGIRQKGGYVDNWLYRRLRQRCLNYLRGEHRYRRQLNSYRKKIKESYVYGVEEAVEWEMVGVLREGVERLLRGRTQEVMRMYQRGLSQKEIAVELKVTMPRVSRLMQKGVKLLKKWLQERGFLEGG